MDNRRRNDRDPRCPNKEDSTRNPYYNQPTHSPYKGQAFAVASMAFGIASMLLTCLGIVPFICAAFSFIFASLGYRKGKINNRMITNGILTSCLGIISAVTSLIRILGTITDSTAFTSYRQYLEQFSQQIP